MYKITIGVGVLLILVGVLGYILTNMASPTALIPAAIGLILVVCGLLAQNPLRRKGAMHGAAGVALLGFLGCADGFLKIPQFLAGQATRPGAVESKVITAVICLVFLVLCVKSFIDARRNPETSGA